LWWAIKVPQKNMNWYYYLYGLIKFEQNDGEKPEYLKFDAGRREECVKIEFETVFLPLL